MGLFHQLIQSRAEAEGAGGGVGGGSSDARWISGM